MCTNCIMFTLCSLIRPHPVLHLRCQPARRFCKWSWNTSTQMSLPPLKVMSFSIGCKKIAVAKKTTHFLLLCSHRVSECRVHLQCVGSCRPAAHHQTEGDVRGRHNRELYVALLTAYLSHPFVPNGFYVLTKESPWRGPVMPVARLIGRQLKACGEDAACYWILCFLPVMIFVLKSANDLIISKLVAQKTEQNPNISFRYSNQEEASTPENAWRACVVLFKIC